MPVSSHASWRKRGRLIALFLSPWRSKEEGRKKSVPRNTQKTLPISPLFYPVVEPEKGEGKRPSVREKKTASSLLTIARGAKRRSRSYFSRVLVLSLSLREGKKGTGVPFTNRREAYSSTTLL